MYIYTYIYKQINKQKKYSQWWGVEPDYYCQSKNDCIEIPETVALVIN